jgi:hypothetical protein
MQAAEVTSNQEDYDGISWFQNQAIRISVNGGQHEFSSQQPLKWHKFQKTAITSPFEIVEIRALVYLDARSTWRTKCSKDRPNLFNMYVSLTNLIKAAVGGGYTKKIQDPLHAEDADHVYIRGDIVNRGPCPGLNALANQGYL